MKTLEVDLKCEEKKRLELEKEIIDKDAEIEHLYTIKKFQDEKIANYM